MKTIVSLHELLERDIKPRALLEEYYAAIRASIPEYFPAETLRPAESPCPGGGRGTPMFEKWGFSYRECERSGSLFVSPRPDEAALIRYFRESPAADFWHRRVLAETDAARTEKLTQPRVDWIVEGIVENRPEARDLLDLSTGSRGLLPGLLEAGIGLTRIVAAAATADLETEPGEGIELRPGPLSGVEGLGRFDVATALDAIDRTADVRAFERTVYEALRPGGLLFITAPTSSGFELQVLWERSPSLVPPDKLNLLSIEAFEELFAAPRWEIVELSTPGVLDVEAVRQAVERDPGADWPRFIRYLVRRRDEDAHHELQLYLQRYRLTSFARLIVRRVEEEG